MPEFSSKLIAILGPTSSGKSDYAIRLAKKVDGEIISVDSRQVYRGMDIGTGKVARDSVSCHSEQSEGSRTTSEHFQTKGIPRSTRNDKRFFSEGIRHHLLDVASPKRDYNVTHFLRDAKKAITDIKKRGKTPILCGGTAFWVEALLLRTSFPEVKPDKKFRARLGKLSAEELFAKLLEKDPERAATIDAKNKLRLIRALEIIEKLGKVPPLSVNNQQSTANGNSLPLCHSREGGNPDSSSWISGRARDDIQIIALSPPKEILHARIEKRLHERLEQGMIEEVQHLHDDGVSWKRLEDFGLEYRWCARFLEKKISREEMEAELLKESKHYAKRQLTFLRRLERTKLTLEWEKTI